MQRLVKKKVMETNRNYYQMTMNEIVFENRNRLYGAYLLRTIWPQHLRTALLIMLSGFTACMLASQVSGYFFKSKPTVNIAPVIDLTEVPIIKKPTVTQPIVAPKLTPPPAKAATVRFTEIVVKKNNAIIDEEQPVHTATIGNTPIGTTTQTGTNEPFIEEPIIGIETPTNNEPWVYVEQMPEYPGGEAALLKYLGCNIKYPAMERENDIQGTVVLKFVVIEDGSVGNIEVMRAISPNLSKEAIRIVKTLKFKPGMQQGQAVKVYYTLPIKFSII